VPYIEVEFPADAVTAVVTGPSVNDSLSHALRIFLDHSGQVSARIEGSKIPFRELTV
jgi:hypothetical protein